MIPGGWRRMAHEALLRGGDVKGERTSGERALRLLRELLVQGYIRGLDAGCCDGGKHRAECPVGAAERLIQEWAVEDLE